LAQEHLNDFALTNLNARLYDPALARFLGMDPFVQSADFTQNFNRYAYGLNNPLLYIDPSGEWALIDDIIAAIVGGVVNLVVNAVQGNVHSWEQGFSYFGVGAAGAWVSLYATPAAGGAIIGAGNSFVTQGFGNNGNWNWSNISGQQILFDGIMGGVTGQLGASLGGLISPYVSNLTSGIGGQAIQQAITQGITGSAVGFTMNTGFALMNGESLGDALKAGGQGALMGFGIGVITGLSSGIRTAYRIGEDPWSGKSLSTTNASTDVYRVVSNAEQQDIRNNGIRVNPDGTGYQDGKLFYTSYEDALKGQALFKNAYGQQSTIVKVTYPTHITNNAYLFQADGMNAVMINSLNLNQSITIEFLK
jgi:RHS repeat-associated protein